MSTANSYRQKLQHLLFLLRHKQVGTAVTAASKLNCSARTIKNRISKLRNDGFVIKYDQGLKRYVLYEDQ